jgi:hypothetical protein
MNLFLCDKNKIFKKFFDNDRDPIKKQNPPREKVEKKFILFLLKFICQIQ